MKISIKIRIFDELEPYLLLDKLLLFWLSLLRGQSQTFLLLVPHQLRFQDLHLLRRSLHLLLGMQCQ
jgi:hypothetical protein